MPTDNSDQYICAVGAIYLLLKKLDMDTICLMGRWWSDKILRYLHSTAKRFTSGLSVGMLHRGDYALFLTAHSGF